MKFTDNIMKQNLEFEILDQKISKKFKIDNESMNEFIDSNKKSKKDLNIYFSDCIIVKFNNNNQYWRCHRSDQESKNYSINETKDKLIFTLKINFDNIIKMYNAYLLSTVEKIGNSVSTESYNYDMIKLYDICLQSKINISNKVDDIDYVKHILFSCIVYKRYFKILCKIIHKESDISSLRIILIKMSYLRLMILKYLNCFNILLSKLPKFELTSEEEKIVSIKDIYR